VAANDDLEIVTKCSGYFVTLTGTCKEIPRGQDILQNNCAVCHSVIDAKGNNFLRHGGRAGPNLYGIQYRIFGGAEGARYSSGLKMLKEKNIPVTSENFQRYMTDTVGFLDEELPGATYTVKHKHRRKQDAAKDIYQFLASLPEDGFASNAE
jgi:cytochrome c